MSLSFDEIVEKANNKLFIIAEAGVNHNGSLEQAKALVDAAMTSGCDAVKFQTWITDNVYSKDKSIKPDYQKKSTEKEKSEYDVIKELELSFNEFLELKHYCDNKGILFLSTPDEIDSAQFLVETLKVPLLKTASQDVTNDIFLEQIADFGLPVIFSTGASTLPELSKGLSILLNKNRCIIPLHCISSYPAPLDQLNLKFIPTLKSMTPAQCVGFSDHTTGTEAACAALALGARVFEKHFTLDKYQVGPDHQASLEPEELQLYCKTLRQLHQGLGDGIKLVQQCEENTRQAFRRFLVLGRDVEKGHQFQIRDFHLKKTVSGIPPNYYDRVISGKAKYDLAKDHSLEWTDIEF